MQRRVSKTLFFVITAVLVSILYAPAQARNRKSNITSLSLTTFNIRWYGLDSSSGPSQQERDLELKNYIKEYLGTSDVIVFQEIVNVERLKKNVIGNSMKCTSYANRGSKHQHIVLCHKPDLKFLKDHDETNYELEGVSLGSSGARPGLHGIIADSSGNNLIRMIGVHLKAFPEETQKRLKQTEVIAKRIASLRDDLPSVVTGDFNSHVSPLNENEKDDKVLMDEVYKRERSNLKIVPNNSYTYRTPEHANQLDHFWVSKSLGVQSRVSIKGPCNIEDIAGLMDYEEDLEAYNTYISDHCPVTVKVQLK